MIMATISKFDAASSIKADHFAFRAIVAAVMNCVFQNLLWKKNDQKSSYESGDQFSLRAGVAVTSLHSSRLAGLLPLHSVHGKAGMIMISNQTLNWFWVIGDHTFCHILASIVGLFTAISWRDVQQYWIQHCDRYRLSGKWWWDQLEVVVAVSIGGVVQDPQSKTHSSALPDMA